MGPDAGGISKPAGRGSIAKALLYGKASVAIALGEGLSWAAFGFVRD